MAKIGEAAEADDSPQSSKAEEDRIRRSAEQITGGAQRGTANQDQAKPQPELAGLARSTDQFARCGHYRLSERRSLAEDKSICE